MSYSSARGDAFATVSAAIASHPGYPVLVLGASDSGRSILVNMIREKGPFMQVKLYEEPPEEPVVFKAVWIVADFYYTCEQIQKTIEIIRDVKENAEKYGVTDDTLWVSVATNGAEAIALTEAVAAHEKAARIAAEEKRVDKMFDILKGELAWVPDGKLLTKTVSVVEKLYEYDNVNELIDMNLSKKHLRMVETVCMRTGDGPMGNIHKIATYDILVLGDAEGGGPHLIEKLYDEENGYGPVHVTCMRRYEDALAEPPHAPYKSVWVVVGNHYSDAQVSKTIEYIRSVKENPDKYPVSKQARWILVATDIATGSYVNDALLAAEDPWEEKTYEQVFEQLDAELEWVSEKNRYRQKISLTDGSDIAELIDIALPVPHLYRTRIFLDPEEYDSKSIASSCVKAMLEVSRKQNEGFNVCLKKTDTRTRVCDQERAKV